MRDAVVELTEEVVLVEEEVPVTEDHMDVVVELTNEEVIEESPTSAFVEV